ncbi:DUF3048 domain-containing protein [Gorillibacterium sp. sgz5001074]|uniref:DUF3048 domain-containing protein n=1 Tax=Gorillibacterium sp. sgz5001074 TaxID=3446695 RepID=UPI003F66FC89
MRKTALLIGCTITILTGGTGGLTASAEPSDNSRQVLGHAVSEEWPDEQRAKNHSPFPLNGLLANTVGDMPRPVMIMVENSNAARPQSGLDQADLVYEILAEGNITRFAAVYQSQAPQVVGPVRSIRPYYVEIGDGLDAIIVHAGWSQEAINMIMDRKLNHFDQVYGDSAYYWRSAERKAPHNLYTGVDKIRQGAAERKMRQAWRGSGLSYAPVEGVQEEGARPVHSPGGGKEAASVWIPYPGGYSVGYRYDGESKLYKREMNGAAHTDKETGRTLTAANILICKTRHKIVDNAGRREVQVEGPGQGYLVQRGLVREVTWKRENGLIRAYEGGVEQELLPGQTWVQIVPDTAAVTFGAF